MLTLLFLIFVGVPFLEMVILIKMGQIFGFWTTLLTVIGIGFVGAFLARVQGLLTVANIQKSLREGKMPAEEMIDALIIFMAGVLLVTPGFLTDVAGLLLLIPWSRFFFKRWLRKKFDDMLRSSPDDEASDFRFFIR